MRDEASLRSEANVLMLLQHMRDMEMWDEMIKVLQITDENGVELSVLSETSPDIGHFEARAYYKRGDKLDKAGKVRIL